MKLLPSGCASVNPSLPIKLRGRGYGRVLISAGIFSVISRSEIRVSAPDDSGCRGDGATAGVRRYPSTSGPICRRLVRKTSRT